MKKFNEYLVEGKIETGLKKYGIIVQKNGKDFNAMIEVDDNNSKSIKSIKNGSTILFSKSDLEYLLTKLNNGFKVSELALK